MSRGLVAMALLWGARAAFAEGDPGPVTPQPSSPSVTAVETSYAPPSPAPTSPHVGRRPAEPPARPARASRLGIALELRSDFGFGDLLRMELSNDRRVALDLNGGLGISVGASFLPLAGGRLGTRVTVGVKAARLRALNGKALFLAFPVDVMETAYVGPLRLGAGLSLLLAPRVLGEGILEASGTSFAPAPGAVADAEWIVSRRTRTGIGVRASWHRFEANGTARGAAALGLLVRADFDLAPGR